MYLVDNVGKLQIEYALDEVLGGRHPQCSGCGVRLMPEDGRIILRRERPNTQGIREGVFFCDKCALKLADVINELLGENSEL